MESNLCKCKISKFNLSFKLILQAQKLIKWKILEMSSPAHIAEPSTHESN
mgnify:FL=1